MLRQLQSVLLVLQVVQLVHSKTATTTLPLELFEVAHSHSGAQSDAISLHDLLLAEEHFQERSHPMSQVLSTETAAAPKIMAEDQQQPRRHRMGKGGNNRRRNNPRQGRQMMSGSSGVVPKIYYVVGASEEDLPICAPQAVCSKIDVYDAPYIERQCRCPESAPAVIYHYNTDRQSTVQKHLENVQRNRPQRILDLNFNVRVPGVEEAYIKELIRKLGAVYEMPEIVLDERALDMDMESIHGGRLLRKRQKLTANRHFDNTIEHVPLKKMRHNHRMDVPKIGGCSAMVGRGDGHTIVDKTRQYKMCEPIHRLPECEDFGYTWSVKTRSQSNDTQQIVHCRCKKNSVTYLKKREPLPHGEGYEFLFACAPPSDMRCLRKEPCKLFSVRKRDDVDEVNTHPLCKCPREHSCPKHHTEAGVVVATNYTKDNVMTYTAYCMADNES